MSTSARRIVLASRPVGRVAASDFATTRVGLDPLRDGQVLLRTEWLSIDPSIRGWLDDRPSYLPPVAIGDVVRSFGLARVVESRDAALPVGTLLRGFVGWQDLQVSDARAGWDVVETRAGVQDRAHLGVLGMTGLTAWVGMHEIAAPRQGETVLVSAAAGAVGSVAAQIAKKAGARVVGVAGGPEKCRILTEVLGLDAAVDHRSATWSDELRSATPNGIDVNFENVGGAVMEGVIARLNDHARMPLCGLIAGYNLATRPGGPANFGLLLTKRVTLTGFIASDHFGRSPEIVDRLADGLADGSWQALETVRDGFDETVRSFVDSFDGAHVGKLLVRL